MEKLPFRKRLYFLLLFCVGALVLIRLLPYFYRCPFYAVTGIPCPGCGMTRAFFAAVHLDWRQALRWNPMVYPFALCCLYAVICFLAGRGKRVRSLKFWGIAGAALLAVWLVRLPSVFMGRSLLTIRPGSLGDFLSSFLKN
jgi:hypothetical protein